MFFALMLILTSALPGTIYHVTNLNDGGAGSLRNCIEGRGVRSCSFSVAGSIWLKSNLVVLNSDLGIYGHTAPGLIELRGAGLTIAASNVKVEHIAVRPGDGKEGPEPGIRDALQISNYKTKKAFSNVRIDHCSFTWAIDENVDIYGEGVSDISITNSIIAEGLYRSIHPDGPHGFGLLVNPGVKRVTLQGNLFAHNYDRNPRMKDGVTANIINNAFYNQGGTSCWNGFNLVSGAKLRGPMINFISNVYTPGHDSPINKKCVPIYWDKNVPLTTRVYVRGNYGPSRTKVNDPEWAISALPETMQALNPVSPLPSIIASKQLDVYLVNNVGPRPAERNKIDARIVWEFVSGTGTIKDCIRGCTRNAGGWE